MRTDLLEQKFVGKNVKIGVPHFKEKGKLFFYYGLLAEVTDNDVVVFTNKQMIRIDNQKIIEIQILDDDYE